MGVEKSPKEVVCFQEMSPLRHDSRVDGGLQPEYLLFIILNKDAEKSLNVIASAARQSPQP